jgi:hypothetical protein
MSTVENKNTEPSAEQAPEAESKKNKNLLMCKGLDTQQGYQISTVAAESFAARA